MNSISQAHFENILVLMKVFENKKIISLSGEKDKITRWKREIISVDGKENFLIDFFRPKLSLNKNKMTLNIRYRNIIIILRIDLDGIHTNPKEVGGNTFEGPHIHIYNEKYGDDIAYSLDKIGVSKQEIDEINLQGIFKKLMIYFKTNCPELSPETLF